LESSKSKKDLFDKLNGSRELLSLLKEESYVIWKLRTLCEKAREYFLPIRKRYLLPDYV